MCCRLHSGLSHLSSYLQLLLMPPPSIKAPVPIANGMLEDLVNFARPVQSRDCDSCNEIKPFAEELGSRE